LIKPWNPIPRPSCCTKFCKYSYFYPKLFQSELFSTFFKVAFFIKHSNPSFVFFTMIPTVLFTVKSRCCQTKTITSKTFQFKNIPVLKHSYFENIPTSIHSKKRRVMLKNYVYVTSLSLFLHSSFLLLLYYIFLHFETIPAAPVVQFDNL